MTNHRTQTPHPEPEALVPSGTMETIQFSIGPELHAAAVLEAERRGISVTQMLRRYLETFLPGSIEVARQSMTTAEARRECYLHTLHYVLESAAENAERSQADRRLQACSAFLLAHQEISPHQLLCFLCRIGAPEEAPELYVLSALYDKAMGDGSGDMESLLIQSER